jgi:chorismate mutase/prephenate dehydratase
MSREKIDEFRSRIDALDNTLVEALAERQRTVADLTELKADSAFELRDPVREQELLARVGARAEQLGLSGYFVRALFREILDHSVRTQQQHMIDRKNPQARAARKVMVAFQGADGAYSQIAAEQHFAAWGGAIESRGYHSFFAMLEAVSAGAADYGMLPVENTTAGSINDAYDLLAQTSLSVVGEEVLRVEHCLVGLPGAQIGDIRRVFSHPQALAQCSVFLSGLRDCAVQAFTDTAMSVQKVKDEGDPSQAGVASERAASLYGLSVLARNIENQKGNYTRFMVVARAPLRLDERIACKTSLIFSTRHEQGALVRCLNVLADRGLNLTKLESRPRPDSPFEYLFYVDFEGNLESAAVQQALAGMRQHTNYLKLLGCYPKARG